MTTRRAVLAFALGLTLAVGPMSSETRAASECAVSIAIFGISVDVCADPDPETSRARQARRRRGRRDNNSRGAPGSRPVGLGSRRE